MLIHRRKHAHDIALQMRAGLRHTVQENRLFERRLREFSIAFIQVVGLKLDVWHIRCPRRQYLGSNSRNCIGQADPGPTIKCAGSKAGAQGLARRCRPRKPS